MYPITRERVMVVISSSVAENAVCWCDGRKKRSRRILRRLTHLAGGGRVIGGAESGMAIGFSLRTPVFPAVHASNSQPQGTQGYTGETEMAATSGGRLHSAGRAEGAVPGFAVSRGD